MEKKKVEEAYRLLFDLLPCDKRWELLKCSHAGEIIDLARRFSCPLSRDECVGIYKMPVYPEHFNKLPPDAIL